MLYYNTENFMSIQVNQYVGYGYILPYKETEKILEKKYGEDNMEDLYDKYYDSAYDKKIVEINGFSMINDGMSGQYFFFGKIFVKTKTDEMVETMELPKLNTKVKKELLTEFQNVFGYAPPSAPNICIISHYR